MRREAAFQTKFNKWLRENHRETAAYELKQSDGPMPFSRVEEHQLLALKAVKHNILIHKIADDTRLFKPFDAFVMSKVPAFVVILYRDTGNFHAIDIDDFWNEDNLSNRRSLTEFRAKEIAAFSGHI
jgi:hypothetical protein